MASLLKRTTCEPLEQSKVEQELIINPHAQEIEQVDFSIEHIFLVQKSELQRMTQFNFILMLFVVFREY